MAATTEDRAYSALPNKAVSAADGIDYAYRDTVARPAAPCRWSYSSTSAATSTAGIPR
jgi:hypothetical protein